jgi:dCMP deaminase
LSIAPTDEKWDLRFLEMAKLVSSWSKDPSTKVGAVIVNQERRVISTGYNGFPIGVEDSPGRYADRGTKYRMVLHAETNAILFSKQNLGGCLLYCTHLPCTQCTAMIIQVGIDRIVSYQPTPEMAERWGGDWDLAAEMRKEAYVDLRLY